MLLNEPGHTNYDIHFNLFGFPVRIHPAFFILPIIFGARAGDGPAILVFVIVFFVSIFIHELGHAFAFRRYGQNARIVLYMMGGLAIPDSGNPWQPATRNFSPRQQIIVSFAGPLAGFILAGVIALIIKALNGNITIEFWGVIPIPYASFEESTIASNYYLQLLLYFGLLINVFLNLLNLAPVYPLDGGQIARQLFMTKDAWNGIKNSLILSIATAGLLAVFALTSRQTFMALFFGFMAYSNWQMLQQSGGGGFGGQRPW